jgi:hypothetical protein
MPFGGATVFLSLYQSDQNAGERHVYIGCSQQNQQNLSGEYYSCYEEKVRQQKYN